MTQTRYLSRQQFEASRKAQQAEAKKAFDLTRALALLRSAEVAQIKLTGSPEWNAYLRQLQALQDADRARIEDLQGQLASAEYLDEAAIAKLRHAVSGLQIRIQTREQCMNLPQEILAHARRAAEAQPGS